MEASAAAMMAWCAEAQATAVAATRMQPRVQMAAETDMPLEACAAMSLWTALMLRRPMEGRA